MVEIPANRDQYRFRHIQNHNVLYQSLLSDDRRLVGRGKEDIEIQVTKSKPPKLITGKTTPP